jgi:hypothetical protein
MLDLDIFVYCFCHFFVAFCCFLQNLLLGPFGAEGPYVCVCTDVNTGVVVQNVGLFEIRLNEW